MKFLVIVQRDVTYGESFDMDEAEAVAGREVDPDDVFRQDVSKVILCEDTRAVCKAVLAHDNWSVWEVTPKGVVQRAITFVRDGQRPYDVTVS